MDKRKYDEMAGVDSDDDTTDSPPKKRVKNDPPDPDWALLQNYIMPRNYNDSSTSMDAVEQEATTIWVAPTHLKNYFLNDTILDYFKMQDEHSANVSALRQPASSNNPIFQQGYNFEAKIWDYLRTKYPSDSIKIAATAFAANPDDIQRTIKAMEHGYAIIYQAPLQDTTAYYRGSCDLLIRSDWLRRLFTNLVELPQQHGCRYNRRYHYIVVDIKWMILKLRANRMTSLSYPLLRAYQAQLGLYNYMLGQLQDYTPTATYILGKSVQIGQRYYNTWYCPAIFTYSTSFLEEMVAAIEWRRSVRQFGATWIINGAPSLDALDEQHGDSYAAPLLPPSLPSLPLMIGDASAFLYPNMTNKYDAPYTQRKRAIAHELKELTLVWNIGIKQRRVAHEAGVYRWDDIQCTSDVLGLHQNSKISTIVDKILLLNRCPHLFQQPDASVLNATEGASCFFLDFETVQSCLLDDTGTSCNNNIVFMIGLGHITHMHSDDSSSTMQQDTWTYLNWAITSNNKKREFRNIRNMLRYVCEYQSPVIYHWSHAEYTTLQAINRSHNGRLHKYLSQITFVDLYKVFYDNNIVIPGALSFTLKDIATALYNRGHITTAIWSTSPAGAAPTSINNGFDAMMSGIQLFKNFNKAKFDEIVKYNEIDCRVLFDIYTWLLSA
jgi:hypothetical protein